MPPPPNSNIGFTAEIRMEPSVIFGAFFVGVVATFLATLFPAFRVSRIPIVEALRRIV
jgi:putative ABC transport system permease protein